MFNTTHGTMIPSDFHTFRVSEIIDWVRYRDGWYQSQTWLQKTGFFDCVSWVIGEYPQLIVDEWFLYSWRYSPIYRNHQPTISWISPSGWLVFPWSPSGLPSIFYGSTGPFEITPGASEWCREVSRGGWEDLGRGRGVANFSVAKSQDPPGTDGDFWWGFLMEYKINRD